MIFRPLKQPQRESQNRLVESKLRKLAPSGSYSLVPTSEEPEKIMDKEQSHNRLS